MFKKKLIIATLLAAAITGGSLVTSPPAQAAAQVYNPCQRLSKGQTKFSGFGANRVTFATATDRNSNRLTITGCRRSGTGYVQEWQDWGYGGLRGFSPQNKGWENTFRTPTGSFSMTEALGRKNPGTALKYRTIKPSSRWGGERGRTYNQYFEGRGGPSDENLWTYMNQGYYEQAAVINYNRLPDAHTVQGASFAIFFHAGRVPSAGCVSTSLSTVVRLLKTNRPGDRIIMGAVDDIFTPYSSNPFGAITAKYARSGGPAGLLGNPASNEVGRLARGGAQQLFGSGTIVWSSATGARITTGAIRSAWTRAGAQNGILRYPTTDEVKGLRNGGKYQSFQGGAIHWSPATGAHPTIGAIRTKWVATGSEKGRLGYPTSSEIPLANGGRYQTFQGGAIYWTKATGAHISVGGIRAAWSLSGYQKGSLGYPTTDEVRVPGGYMQRFQGGSIYWSSATGGRSLIGAMDTKFTAAGGLAVLGFPVAEQSALFNGGFSQRFQKGALVSSPAKSVFLMPQKIHEAWIAAGAEKGALGYPVSDPKPVTGGTAQAFAGGSIVLGTDGVARTVFPVAEPAPTPTAAPAETTAPTPAVAPSTSPTPEPTETAVPAPAVTPSAAPTDSPTLTSGPATETAG